MTDKPDEVLDEKARQFFRDAGKRGGLERAKRLGPVGRQMGASKAATARWRKVGVGLSAWFTNDLRKAMKQSLTKGEEQVLCLLHAEGHTQAEIAKLLGISQQAVSQREKSAMEKLRANPLVAKSKSYDSDSV